MKGPIRVGAAVVAIAAVAAGCTGGDAGGTVAAAGSSQQVMVPQYVVDPSWPKYPDGQIVGQVTGLAAGPDNDVWVLQRPNTAASLGRDSTKVMPAVLRFDPQGNFLQSWGGNDYELNKQFEWPQTPHGITVDFKNNVWIAGNGGKDNTALKFTADGQFILQIGHQGMSKGNHDTENLNRAADVYVDPTSNQAYMADGYGNRRVIVYNADTGAFVRMWGAFGNQPTDPAENEPPNDWQSFHLVHSVRIAKDGNVYVADRQGMRLQQFKTDGTFIREKYFGQYQRPDSVYMKVRANDMADFKNGKPPVPVTDLINATATAHWTVSRTAFSPDPAQKYLYLAERSAHEIEILDRATLEVLTRFGRHGTNPGEFYVLHDMVADPTGNIYTAEVNDGARAQKFTYMGDVPKSQDKNMTQPYSIRK